MGFTEEGHDGCIGTLSGVMNACCGHGDVKQAYIQFTDGKIVRAEEAIRIFNKQKMDRKSVQ
ncbi:hypothetical protein [Leptobacterium sp. I13]|uniref:hypothetical protein n=1 Tax=Leptobacterium meishanense TaxID=3128904 RepID=UPI0030ED84ED